MSVAHFLHEYGHLILDHGPHYHEFDPHSIIREPINALSSLFFLVPVWYWYRKLKGQYKKQMQITILLPLLFLNGIGSTLFHAFRAYDAFLILDFAPAALMSLMVATYMWFRVTHRWWLSVIFVLGFMALRITMYALEVIPEKHAINIGYLLTGIMFFLPGIFILARQQWKDWHLLLYTAMFLGGALLFRYLDHPRPNLIPPIGTHFLWHIVSAFAVFTLGEFLYRVRNRDFQ